MRWSLLLGVCVTVTACSHSTRIGVRTGVLLAHAKELGSDGQAQLDTVTVKRGVVKPADPMNVALDRPVAFQGKRTTLGLLMQGCKPFAGAMPCALLGARDELVYLRPLATFKDDDDDDWVPPPQKPTDGLAELKVVFGGLALGSLGGMAACLAYCEEDRGLKSAALGGGALLFGLVLLLLGGDVHD